MTCKLYKVSLLVDDIELVFWGYHMDEARARDAALRWGETNHGHQVTIARVDIIG